MERRPAEVTDRFQPPTTAGLDGGSWMGADRPSNICSMMWSICFTNVLFLFWTVLPGHGVLQDPPLVFLVCFGVFISVNLTRAILKTGTHTSVPVLILHPFRGAASGSDPVKVSESQVGSQVGGFPLRRHPLLLDMSDTASLPSEAPPPRFTS